MRRHRAHYDVILMKKASQSYPKGTINNDHCDKAIHVIIQGHSQRYEDKNVPLCVLINKQEQLETC